MSRPLPRWPLFLIAAPAAVAVWSGWVGLGTLCGFGMVHPLPGIADGFQINTAITLPVGVEAYGAYALRAWLTPGACESARRFARWSAIGSLALGMLGHVVYHLLSAEHASRAPWPVVVLVSCLPVVTLGFGAALTHLLHGTAAEDVPGPVPIPALDDDAETVASVTADAVPTPCPRSWPRQWPGQWRGALDVGWPADTPGRLSVGTRPTWQRAGCRASGQSCATSAWARTRPGRSGRTSPASSALRVVRRHDRGHRGQGRRLPGYPCTRSRA